MVLGDLDYGSFESVLGRTKEDPELCRHLKAYAPTERTDGAPWDRDVHLWPGGLVPYSIHPDFEVADPFRPGRTKADRIRELVDGFAALSNVAFVEVDDATAGCERVRFLSRTSDELGVCKGSAEVGYALGAHATCADFPRTVKLGDDASCSVWNNQGTLWHELGHSLGLAHEQQRGDRDEHVRVYRKLVRSSARSNYSRSRYGANRLDSPYDVESYMHYGGASFPPDDIPRRANILSLRTWSWQVVTSAGTNGLDDRLLDWGASSSFGMAPGVEELPVLEGEPLDPRSTVLVQLSEGPADDDFDLVAFASGRLWRADVGAPSPSWQPFSAPVPFAVEGAELRADDLDGDGEPEFALASAGDPVRVAVFEPATNTWHVEQVGYGGLKPWGLHLVDWDGDGALDVVADLGGDLAWFVPTGAGTLSGLSSPIRVGASSSVVAIANLDADAEAELLLDGGRVVDQDGTLRRLLDIPDDVDRFGRPRAIRRPSALGDSGVASRAEIFFMHDPRGLSLYVDGSGPRQDLRPTAWFGSMEDVIVGHYRKSDGTVVEMWISYRFDDLGSSEPTALDIAGLNDLYPVDPNPRHLWATGSVIMPAPCELVDGQLRGFCP